MTLNEELTKLAVDSYDKGVNDAKQSAMEVFAIAIDLARADEREACAKVCDDKFAEYPETDPDYAFALAASDLAKAIRARGNK
jgi:hypothetical protein